MGSILWGRRARGLWSEAETALHINYLELLAVFFGLKCFAMKLSNCNILCRVDNTTALAYINKMGSVQYPKLNQLARSIWQWCERRKLFLAASYICSADNKEADMESRRLSIDTEWSLNETVFSIITHKLGKPDIDLFASRNNTKCKKFISWLRDPESYAIDAFTVKWEKYFFYAFPPFVLILKVLRKIMSDKARGILVVPLWKSQSWYPILYSMIEGKPLMFQPNEDLLSFNRTPHPLWRTTTLVAAIVSSRH